MLYSPERHEPLRESAFSDAGAQAAIERIAERADGDVDDAWLYTGTAGIA